MLNLLNGFLGHTKLALHHLLILGFTKLPEKRQERVGKVRGREEFGSLKIDLESS